MGSRDARIDAYIAKSAPFAQPILAHLRELVHATCPAVQETVKWGFPHFEHHGILCSMAAHKAHASFGFWKGNLVVGDADRGAEGMGQLGRITALKDLPPKRTLQQWIRTAMALNESGEKAPRPPKREAKPLPAMPDELSAALALRRHLKARTHWDAFPPSHRREYLEWILDAKTAPTRERRVAQTLEWVADGKGRNWKYTTKQTSR